MAVGNIAPGEYRNQALLENLPIELGPRRWSDNPNTPDLDSTVLVVLGVETDTLYVSETICGGSPLVLDGGPYGVEFQWFDGTENSTAVVTAPGIYELTVFDGCEPTTVFFDVVSGEFIDITFDKERKEIHLGDTLVVTPQIVNTGTVLDITWSDPLEGSLICTEPCTEAELFPRWSTLYRVYASNEHCVDSASIFIYVDNTRFVFVPNVFTPNLDGINDFLGMYSPDYGVVESFDVKAQATEGR